MFTKILKEKVTQSMKTLKQKTKVKTVSIVEKKNSSNQLKILDKDILKAVQIQDSMRKKYKADKDWNAVDIIRRIRDNS